MLLFPEQLAIFSKVSNAYINCNYFGLESVFLKKLPIVFCAFFPCYMMTPISPSFLKSSLTSLVLLPQTLATVLVTDSCPTPVSFPI